MSKVFVKFNTGVSASAACEQLFSVGKDVLSAKQNWLSDKNFDCSCVVWTSSSALESTTSA